MCLDYLDIPAIIILAVIAWEISKRTVFFFMDKS